MKSISLWVEIAGLVFALSCQSPKALSPLLPLLTPCPSQECSHPSIDHISPQEVPSLGEQEITIFGSCLDTVQEITIQNQPVLKILKTTPDYIRIMAPPSSQRTIGLAEVKVRRADGQVAIGSGLIAYRPAKISFKRGHSSLVYSAGDSLVTSTALADIDGDGFLDYIFADGLTGEENGRGTARITTIVGNQHGDISSDLGSYCDYRLKDAAVLGLVVADINHDQRPDLVLSTDQYKRGIAVFLGIPITSKYICPFAAPKTFPTLSPTGTNGVAVADFNEDGHLDVIATSYANNQVELFLGDGQGELMATATISVGKGPIGIATADFNQDGYLDVAVASTESNQIDLLLGQGTGMFQPSQVFSTGKNPRGLLIADLNRDGAFDIVTANSGSGNLSVLLGDRTGSFHTTFIEAGPNPYSLATADFNGDGYQDILVGNVGFGKDEVFLSKEEYRVRLFFGDPTGLILSAVQVTPNGFSVPTLAVGDVNADGAPDFVFGLSYSGFFANRFFSIMVNEPN